MPTIRLAAILATMMLAACVTSQPTGEKLAPVAAADFDAKFDGAVCVVWARCGHYAELADCLAAMPLSQQIRRLQRLEDIARGAVSYDGSRAAACINDIAASSCDRIELAMSWKGERLCERFEHGLIPDGGACSHDEECTSNGCSSDSSTCFGACCPGHCAPHVSVGAGGDCGTDRARCEDGLTCSNGICRRDHPVGAGCTLFEDCPGGLVCNGGTCSPPPTEGELCTHASHCATIDLSCETTALDPVYNPIRNCLAAVDVGQPCRLPGEITERPPCKADAVCEAQHHICVPLPAVGEDCPDGACAPGAFCIGVPEGTPTRNVCRALLPVGAACTRGEQCAPYLCATTTHTCVPSETNVCSF